MFIGLEGIGNHVHSKKAEATAINILAVGDPPDGHHRAVDWHLSRSDADRRPVQQSGLAPSAGNKSGRAGAECAQKYDVFAGSGSLL